jgi:aminoglycoside phosphotransferase (APT) family kinase protein
MRQLAAHTAALHAVPVPNEDDPSRVVRHQLARWRAQLAAVAAPRVPALEGVFEWLAEHLPVPTSLALVHGDLRPGNFLYDEHSVTGILDWELAHLGDPAEDLAWAYVGRWSPARLLSVADFVATYESAGGQLMDPVVLSYHRVYAEARFAVISHRAASLFSSGASTNLRHADRVRELALALDACWTLIDADGRQ